MERYTIIGLLFSILLFAINTYLFRRRKISAKMFTQWFIISMVIGLVALIPQAIRLVYIIAGTQYLATAFTGLAFLSLLLIIYYLQYKINQLSNKVNKILPIILSNINIEYLYSNKKEKIK